MIFQPHESHEVDARLTRESLYSYYCRSKRKEVIAVRQFLNMIIVDYPDRDGLISRFKSRKDSEFHSAEFELLLFHALASNGFELEIHPEVEDSNNRPDFLVKASGVPLFYLEAVLASQKTENENANKLVQSAIDVFSKHSHHHFNVCVKTNGVPTRAINESKLIREVKAWLDSLDPDSRGSDGYEREFIFAKETFSMNLTAMPLPMELRGKSERMLGLITGLGGWVDPVSGIRNAVKDKGRRYGRPSLPFLVAVNVSGLSVRPEDEVSALFGGEVIRINVETDETHLDREQNGAWTSEKGPQLRRVSGVWIFRNFHAARFGTGDPTLYLNPWADYNLPENLLMFSHRRVVAGWIGEKTVPTSNSAKL